MKLWALLILPLGMACKPQNAPNAAASSRALDSLEALEAVPVQVLTGRYCISKFAVDDSSTRVEVRVQGNDALLFQAVVTHLDPDDEHFADFVPEALFVLKRMGDTSTTTWSNELWKIPVKDAPVRIAQVTQGLLYWVSPNGEVVLESDTGTAGAMVHLLDGRGKVLQQRSVSSFGLEVLDQLFMGADGAYLAGKQRLLHWDFRRNTIDSVSWPADIYAEYSIQPKRALLMGSTQAVTSEDQDDEPQDEIILFAVDLKSGRRQELSRSQGQDFAPRWITEDSIEFSDPATSARVRRLVVTPQ